MSTEKMIEQALTQNLGEPQEASAFEQKTHVVEDMTVEETPETVFVPINVLEQTLAKSSALREAHSVDTKTNEPFSWYVVASHCVPRLLLSSALASIKQQKQDALDCLQLGRSAEKEEGLRARLCELREQQSRLYRALSQRNVAALVGILPVYARGKGSQIVGMRIEIDVPAQRAA